MGFGWFLIGSLFGGICYRWAGAEIEEFLDWLFSSKGGK